MDSRDIAVLVAIAESEPCRVKDIELSLGIGSGVARTLLDRLEAVGHCIRHRNAGQRGLVSLTESGLAVLAQLSER